MRFAVFFRNLNLGRPPAPTRLHSLDAFQSAGADHAESFQTNGTAVFDAPTLPRAKAILRRTRDWLRNRQVSTSPPDQQICGWDRRYKFGNNHDAN